MPHNSHLSTIPVAFMTDMQRQWFLGLANGLNPNQAAKAAGAKNPTIFVRSCMENPAICQALEQLNEKLINEINITRKEVIEGFRHAIDCAETASEQIAGWKEIGRMLGFYEPEKHEHIVRPESATERELREMTDAQLAQMLGRGSLAPEPITIDQEVERVEEDDA